MAPFNFAHATGETGQEAVVKCVGQLAPASGGFGLVYVTDALVGDLPATIEMLRETTGVTDWVGSVGLGVCAQGTEYFDEPGIAVMIVDTGEHRVFETIKGDLSEFEQQNASWIARHGCHFGIVHADPRNAEVPGIVSNLADALDGFLVGGLSSAHGVSAQVAGGAPAEGGVSGVLLSEEIAVATALSQSCTLIGEKHRVTAGVHNIIETLDGEPALDVFKRDIGDLLARDLRRVGGYILAALPVPGSDTGDYLVRNLVGIDTENQVIAISEMVEPGMTIQFCRRDGAAAETDLIRMVADVKRRANGTPRGALYFSCLARGPNLFGEKGRELALIERELGSIPLVGFFCNGEISHDRLYGYTGVLTLFQ